ncbi:Stp1/IreP family PP2C-type Ser/Thr phosphatase [Undibacterium sp. Jales W-56]|uniref:Stp1/IreP family PP2C-type Ser/Thr phosphatase n=1 Tax=Undibacterium sp. Jales W-56 TaxID=2897325 RepID=UPI0021D2326F|nr:Stp1/IreP family PP2C-type Ser/Thr phosphatase [Undibacterium sp. Jales W-56]MCU6434553.1 Stp1/IreP family PP2C-type Ser/Thr phosphatase [Undibacterium sp. Jales W-56]
MSFQRVLEFAGLSDTGLVRAHNEDAIEICAEADFAVLADGMGGYNAGEVASKMTVDSIKQQLLRKKSSTFSSLFGHKTSIAMRWIKDAIDSANHQVWGAAQDNAEFIGMGTTVVVAFCHYDKLLVAHVGDSRAYRYRSDKLLQITHDHSVLQAQIDAGLISQENAQHSPIKNLITRAVGAQDDVEVEIHEHAMEEGDIYLLCSDGLTDMLNHDQIHHLIRQHADNLKLCCKVLIDSANEQGGRDNISVILMKISKLESQSLKNYILSK